MNETTKPDETAIAGSDMLAVDLTELIKLTSRLKKVEKELEKCRTSVIEDGWQTQRHAKKSRKWDILAQEKMNLLQKIEDYELR